MFLQVRISIAESRKKAEKLPGAVLVNKVQIWVCTLIVTATHPGVVIQEPTQRCKLGVLNAYVIK